MDPKVDSIEKTIFVGGLAENVTQEDIYNLFVTFGIIRSIEMPADHISGKPKGFAFVEYEEIDDADQAIDNFDEAEIFGRIVHIKKAKQYKAKQSKAIWESEQWQIQQAEIADEKLQLQISAQQ